MPQGTVPLFNTDPNIQAQAALIAQRQAMAQALLQQGMTPLDTSNRAIGGVAYHVSPLEGLAKMLQTYSGREGIQSAVQDQANLAAQAYGALLQKYQPSGSAQYTPEQVSQAEGQGMAADGYGPPDPKRVAAALMGQEPQRPPMNPNNPMNIPAQILAAHDAGMIGDKQFEALTSAYAPTDASKAAVQGGGNPVVANQQAFAKSMSDPKIWAMQQAGLTPQQIYAATAGEAEKGAALPVKPGEPLYMFNGSGAPSLKAVAPNAGENMQFQVGPGGSVSATGVPGAVRSRAGMEGGMTAARTGESLTSVTLPGGRVVPVRGNQVGSSGTLKPDADTTAIYQGELQASQERLAKLNSDPRATPDMKARAQQDVNDVQKEMKRLGIPLGQSTQDKITQEAGAKVLADLPMQLQQSKQTVAGLENAYKTIEALDKAGPGVSRTVNALAILNNLGIPVAKGDVNGFQTLKKYLENSASTAAASNGFTGSDARFEQFKAGQPNADTMNPDALKGAIRYVLSQNDAAIARAQFIQQQVQANPGDPNAAQKAQTQWSQTFNPRIFEFSRATPQERAEMKSKMSPQQRTQFGQAYNFAHQQGWVQ
jgi:hypothetical protein